MFHIRTTRISVYLRVKFGLSVHCADNSSCHPRLITRHPPIHLTCIYLYTVVHSHELAYQASSHLIYGEWVWWQSHTTINEHCVVKKLQLPHHTTLTAWMITTYVNVCKDTAQMYIIIIIHTSWWSQRLTTLAKEPRESVLSCLFRAALSCSCFSFTLAKSANTCSCVYSAVMQLCMAVLIACQ